MRGRGSNKGELTNARHVGQLLMESSWQRLKQSKRLCRLHLKSRRKLGGFYMASLREAEIAWRRLCWTLGPLVWMICRVNVGVYLYALISSETPAFSLFDVHAPSSFGLFDRLIYHTYTPPLLRT